MCLQLSTEGSALPKKEQKLEMNREIETLLMIHEKKSGSGLTAAIPGMGDANESDSSDSEAEMQKPSANSEGRIYKHFQTTVGALVSHMCVFMSQQ